MGSIDESHFFFSRHHLSNAASSTTSPNQGNCVLNAYTQPNWSLVSSLFLYKELLIYHFVYTLYYTPSPDSHVSGDFRPMNVRASVHSVPASSRAFSPSNVYHF